MMACNFDANAFNDDGTCDFSCYGCTDSDACNYDADATIDDGNPACSATPQTFGDTHDAADNATLSAESSVVKWRVVIRSPYQ